MTREEAEKIAAVIATADGGCGPCVSSLCELMSKAFPAFEWAIGEADRYPDQDVVVRDAAREGCN